MVFRIREINWGQSRTASCQIPSKFDLSSQDDEEWVYCVSHLVPDADETERRESL